MSNRSSKHNSGNSNTSGVTDIVFAFGSSGDQPIAGDWNSDGTDTIGLFRPSEAKFYLRNANAAGNADLAFAFGNTTDVPIAEDWDGQPLTLRRSLHFRAAARRNGVRKTEKIRSF